MTTLAEIRKKLAAQESRNSGETQQRGDGAVYPFWNLEDGKESTVRFLPDGDSSNTFFWVEKTVLKFPFAGVKGENDNKQVFVQVPCMEMYGERCPVLDEVRAWFKDPSLEELGRRYWKKKSYLFQGFVVESGMKEENTPENPIRRFIIGPQVFQLIKSALVDPELDELPTDYVHGLDFKLVKGKKGQYADYSTSKWSRRERPLSEDELAAIDTHGLPNLKDLLPKKPGSDEMRVIMEMFQASVDGEPYDPEAWGQYYRPAGMAAPAGTTRQAAVEESAPAPRVEVRREEVREPVQEAPKVEAPKVEAPAASTDSRATDILAMIRNRTKAQ